jgi:hypothetical protein
MLKLEIKDETVEERVINPKGGGSGFTIYEQKARLAINDEIRNIRLSSRSRDMYKKGIYTISDSSFYVNQYGSLQLGRLVLEPISG